MGDFQGWQTGHLSNSQSEVLWQLRCTTVQSYLQLVGMLLKFNRFLFSFIKAKLSFNLLHLEI